MSIRNRPYVGSWQMNRTLVRHTPDAIVYVNGHSEFSVCASCNKKLDLNKYITSVSCDAGIEPNASATLNLSVPKMSTDVFSHDGNYVLRPGLEVVIFMRGYFPMDGYVLLGQESQEDSGTPVYPYYQVFRGVVTSASHSYSGGFYTASLSCANLLHFWTTQYLSTNGSVFGPRPEGSGVGPDLTGHAFTGSTPYNIIYTLMRTGFGAAYSVGWSINQRTNISAESDDSGKSMYAHAAEWWEKRWQSSSMKLRMYGFDGRIFNFLEQAYIGMFGSRSSTRDFVLSYNTLPDGTSNNFDMEAGRQAAARAVGFSGEETTAAFMDTNGYRMDVLKMQAFTYDLGRVANVNFFESEYMSKMEIAEAVTLITGFEFYQDVDGDMVFKPPFYNMDTRDDPVYVIEDRDLISINETESEPEATYVKGTGGLFGNTTGVLSGEFGTKQSMYIDWRLVAKFGWKEASFESNYLNNASQLFVSAISRLDIANAGSKTAEISIPIRPEMRPGYPVYVRSLDCFFYVRSISHTFSPGGECTTSLTCVAKRSKFLPPGLPDRSEGRGSSPIPRLSDVRLGGGGSYPPMPLYVYPEDVEGNDGNQSSGPPRIMGFPNCVMALDPGKVNMGYIGDGSLVFSQPDNAFEFALKQGVLHRDPENEGQYRLENGDGTYLTISKDSFLSSWSGAYTLVREQSENPSKVNYERLLSVLQGSDSLAKAIIQVTIKFNGAVEDPSGLRNWVAIQKSLKSMYGYPAVPGTYRYFSSSAQDSSDQSPSSIIYRDKDSSLSFERAGPAPSGANLTVLRQVGDRIKIQSGKPELAFRVFGFTGQDQADYKDTTTDQVKFVTFQKVSYTKTVSLITSGSNGVGALLIDSGAFYHSVVGTLVSYSKSVSPDEFASKRLGTDGNGYSGIFEAITKFESALGSNSSNERTTASNLSNAISGLKSRGGKPKYGGRSPDSKTVLETVFENTKNKTDPSALGILAADASSALKNYLDSVQGTFKNKVDSGELEVDEGTSNAIVTARNSLLSKLDGYDDSTPESPISYSEVEKEVGVPTLVLPVSDNAGYEVYGGLAYGRGITIESQYRLLSTEGRSIDAGSAEAVEAFISGLVGTGANVPGVLGAISPERKAILAANLGLPNNAGDGQIQSAIEVLVGDSKSGSAFIRNNPITSKTRGMSYTETMGVESLANLTFGDQGTGLRGAGEVCICKGVEASYFMQAFSGEYVDLNGGDVGEFLREEALVSGETWQLTRDAVSGKSQDSGQYLLKSSAVAYEKTSESVRTAVGGIRNAIDGEG